MRICFNSLFRCTFLELHHFPSNFCNFVILMSASKEKSEARLIFFFFLYMYESLVCVSLVVFLCLDVCETLFL